MPARIMPPGAGMRDRPMAGPPGWIYVQNGIFSGDVLRSREGAVLYADTASGSTAMQGGVLLVPHVDPRGYRLLWALRDVPGLCEARCYSGTNEIAALAGAPSLLWTSQNLGFPVWASLNDRIHVARRGDPVMVLGVDDGGEPYVEALRALDRESTTLDIDFDDNGPYLREVPEADVVASFLGRLWAFKGRRMWWSNAWDPEGWPASNFADLDGGAVYAAAVLGDRLCAFHEDGVSVILGEPANGGSGLTIRRLPAVTHGCLSPRSLVEIDGRIWFLSQRAQVCAFDGASVEVVTAALRNLLTPQTALTLEPTRIPRVETPSLPDAAGVHYSRWNTYIVWMEGETRGVHDLGIAVDLDGGRVSVMTGPDVRAACVFPSAEPRLLTYDRFGMVYAQDHGAVDRLTTETFGGSAYTRSANEARVPFVAVPHPSGIGDVVVRRDTELRMLVEHHDARAPVVRPVTATMRLSPTYRARTEPPQIIGSQKRALYAGYLAEAGVPRDHDFVIGTTPVQPDGFVPAKVGFGDTNGESLTFEIGNDRTPFDETTADHPDTVGLAVAVMPDRDVSED